MAEQELTNEFSICLFADKDMTGRINSLRSRLPESPYRDDPPHITLLRGIQTRDHVEDEVLVSDLERILQISKKLPFDAVVSDVVDMDRPNQLYTATSMFMLRPSKELADFRVNIVGALTQSGFTIEQQEMDNYIPHLTIRLGVPLESQMLSWVKKDFIGNKVEFLSWVIFRLYMKDGKRFMHTVTQQQ
jgi:2'-5' RNA ligase